LVVLPEKNWYISLRSTTGILTLKINRVDVFQVAYQLLDRRYCWSRGQGVSSFVSTIVKLTTDSGLVGYGEVCPLGSAYMEAFARGVPEGIRELAPTLLGSDPRSLRDLNRHMDEHLAGHQYVKSPVDIACWDILGKAAQLPVSALLGGRCVERYPLYRAISQGTPEEMAEDVSRYRGEGYRRFQLKVGGNPEVDIRRIRAVRALLGEGDVLVADANTGWLVHEAIRVANELQDERFYLEAPCASYEECLVVRRKSRQPLVLDEIITGVPPLLRAFHDGAMDVVNIKLSRVGGLSKALQLRNLCESLGIAMTIEDSWGGDITTAAIAQLVGSTEPRHLFTSTDFNSYVDLSVAPDAPRRAEGWLSVPEAPGLGVTVVEGRLGKPVFSSRL
jgi:L-alanine-DL-glutamate epimerase-like enolase superfamily enzyme